MGKSPRGMKEELMIANRRERSADRMHIALMLVSCLVAVCFLVLRPDDASNDFHGHLAYLNHIQREPFSPFGYTGRESWHPPTYYYLAALSEHLGAWFGLRPLKGARIFSIVLYLTYLHFGLRTFRLLFTGRVLWCASLLFIAWPSNFEMSTRINSDSAVIPVYAAVQFYLIRSVLRGDRKDSLRALAVSFVGLVFKTSALVPVAIACLVTTGMFVVARARNPQALQGIRPRWGVTLLCVFLLCVGINCSRLIVYQWQGIEASALHLGGKRPNPLSAANLMALRPWRLVENPFAELSPARCSAAEYAFKTAIFTEQPWLGKGRFLGRIWIVLVLFQLLVTGVCFARRAPVYGGRALMWIRQRRSNAHICAGVQRETGAVDRGREGAELVRWAVLLGLALFPVMALLVFSWKQNWTVCGSYRFVHASLVAWIGLLLMPASTLPDERREGNFLSYLGWLGAFALTTWALVCLLLKLFRPILQWN